MRIGDKHKTTFWRIDEFEKDRLYQWKFLPFGLKNALVKFQRVIDIVLVGLPFVKCYIDDILVFNEVGKEHRKYLTMVLERLMEHGLKLHPSKCIFFYL